MLHNHSDTKSKKWIIFVILCFAYIIVFFHRQSVGTIKNDLTSTFHISATTFANLGAAYFYAYLLMQIPTGILVDTIGSKLTVTMGMTIGGIGAILFGYSPNIYWAFAARLMVGVGVSVVLISNLKLINEWFGQKQFATIFGLHAFVGNLGGVFAQTPLIILISLFTWRFTFAMIGIVSIIVALLYLTVVKDKKLPSPTKSVRTSKNTNIFKAIKSVALNVHIWPPFIMFFCFYGVYCAFTSYWGQSYLTSVYGISSSAAGNYMILPVVGYALAAPIPGILSDKLSSRKTPLIALGTLCFISWLVLIFTNHCKPPIEILGIILFVIGASSTGCTLMCTCSKELNDPQYVGISTSFMNSSGFIGASFIPLAMGKILDKYSNLLNNQLLYQKAFFVCFLSMLIGYAVIFFIKETNCQNTYVPDKNKFPEIENIRCS